MPKRPVTTVRARRTPQLPDQLDRAEAPYGAEVVWDGVEADGLDLPPRLDALVVSASRLTRVRGTGARIDELECRDVVFEDCELSGAFLSNARLERVAFVRCRMSGIDLSRASLLDVHLDGCRLDEANLRAATLVQVDAEECELRAADLYGARVERSNLLRSNLTGLDLTKATLHRVALHGSEVVDVQGGAALAGCVISRDQVIALAPSLVAALGIVVDDDFRDAATP